MRLLASLALAGLAAVALAGAALAKEDVVATLIAPLPLNAPPGQTITVSWLLESVDEEGRRRPFGASGVFVQLESASGGESTVGLALGDGGRDGRFEALVPVPAGGIGGIVVGLGGTVSDPAGTRPDYVYFPVRNSPFAAVTEPSFPGAGARPAPGAPAERPPGASAGRVAVLALAGLAALAVVALALRRHHRRTASA